MPDRPEQAVVIRYEEKARPGTIWRVLGFLHAHKKVHVHQVSQRLPAAVEKLVQEHVPVGDDDSGRIETLPDGSVSIPLYQEELLVTRRLVLRERVIIRKETVYRKQRITAELRREIVDIQTDGGVELIDERAKGRG